MPIVPATPAAIETAIDAARTAEADNIGANKLAVSNGSGLEGRQITDDGTTIASRPAGSFEVQSNAAGHDLAFQVVPGATPYIALGDLTASGNNTKVIADDSAQTIALTATNGVTINGDPLPVLTSGTYTPTASAATNLDSTPTMTQAQYMRVGNVVTVSGSFTADPTTTTLATAFEISLPVASDIRDPFEVAGTAVCGNIVSMCGDISGRPTPNTARVVWKATDVTSQTWSYQFTYLVT